MRMTVPVISALVLVFIVILICAEPSDADPAFDYNTGTNTLTIKEDVPDFADSSETPWSEYRDTMANLVVSGSVKMIGSNAFSGCPNLATVRIESSLESVGSGAFDDSGSSVDGFNLVILGNTVPSSMFSPSAGHSVYILTLDLTQVETISADAFRGSVIAASITLPMGISSVGDRAFMGSTVPSVRIEGAPAFGASVFENCTSLTKAEITSMKVIPESMFKGCTSLSDVGFSVRISEISGSAFHGIAVSELVFPGTLKKVKAGAFASCASLEHVAFTDDLSYLEDYAFQGCTALRTAEVQNVSHPGTDIFDGCTSLVRVYCPVDAVTFPAGTVYRDLAKGADVLIRYDFGDLDGSCTLFRETVMKSSYIVGSENNRFDYWSDADGNKVSDISSITESTTLTAHWVHAEGTDGTFDIVLCVLSVGCAAVACMVCLRRS